MARRRDGLAPFEIMGSRASAGVGAGDAPAPPRPEPEPLPTASAGGGAPWWDAGVPVVLRLPRGFAVLVGVAILGLVFLAYWVGYSRGAAAERAAYEEEQTQLRITGRIPSGVGRVVEVPVEGEGGVGANGDRSDATTRPGGGDPRRPGFNYLILARFPHEEAGRLARFLAERGVETAVIPSDTAGLSHVVALRGFTSEQYSAGEHREHEEQLKRLGRDWQAANGGRGDNLSSMYWQLQRAPTPAPSKSSQERQSR